MWTLRFHYWWRRLKELVPWIQTDRSYFLIGYTELHIDEAERRLIALRYQYNYFSYLERGQVSNFRKLYLRNNVIRQVHIRIYSDKEIRMHDEVAYEHDMLAHINGETLSHSNIQDVLEILKVLEARTPSDRQ